MPQRRRVPLHPPHPRPPARAARARPRACRHVPRVFALSHASSARPTRLSQAGQRAPIRAEPRMLGTGSHRPQDARRGSSRGASFPIRVRAALSGPVLVGRRAPVRPTGDQRPPCPLARPAPRSSSTVQTSDVAPGQGEAGGDASSKTSEVRVARRPGHGRKVVPTARGACSHPRPPPSSPNALDPAYPSRPRSNPGTSADPPDTKFRRIIRIDGASERSEVVRTEPIENTSAFIRQRCEGSSTIRSTSAKTYPLDPSQRRYAPPPGPTDIASGTADGRPVVAIASTSAPIARRERRQPLTAKHTRRLGSSALTASIVHGRRSTT